MPIQHVVFLNRETNKAGVATGQEGDAIFRFEDPTRILVKATFVESGAQDLAVDINASLEWELRFTNGAYSIFGTYLPTDKSWEMDILYSHRGRYPVRDWWPKGSELIESFATFVEADSALNELTGQTTQVEGVAK